MNQPIKWHGGKYYLAKWIHSHAPKHLHRVHTHGGGLAEFWNWDYEGVSEVVNDLNGELQNFWKCLQNEETFSTLVRYLQATPMSKPMFEDSLSRQEQHAANFFIRYRQSRQGLGKDFATLSRNRTRRGMNEQVSSWLSAIDGLEECHKRLQRVVIFNEDALDIIGREDGPNTLFYLDPPYMHVTRTATNVYEHEMTQTDHLKLLKKLAQIEGKFMLSGYHSRIYDDYARKNHWTLNEYKIANHASDAEVKEIKTECLWSNYATN